MIDLKGYEDVQAANPGEFPRLTAGGYVCKIIHAELTKSKAGNHMLVLFLDIAEGDFAGYFKKSAERLKAFRPDAKWDNAAIYRQLLFDKDGMTSSFFKGLLTCIVKSNPQFNFNPHALEEKSLRGLLIGCVFAEEEYSKRDGSVGSRVVVKFPKTVDDIRNGNFSVPAVKKLAAASGVQEKDVLDGEPVSDFDIPF